MEDLEKRARRIAQKAEEAAKELARPKPLLSELFGEIGKIELYGRSEQGERFIAELGPPTRITAQTLPREPNHNREVLWETRTWDNWAIQLVHYRDTGKVYLFLNHGPHYTSRLLGLEDAKNLKNALRRAMRRMKGGEAENKPFQLKESVDHDESQKEA
ncbi:MAG: hypothetical protein QMD10_09555 [Desulfitobacteriaceae bacterium]|nr:hypothetical protein [Desulfitobacteriaceae bacterium]